MIGIDRYTWAEGYAEQANSDFRMYKRLQGGEPGVEFCHILHYLQMSCEKIAKAYRFLDPTVPLEQLTNDHVAFSKFIECFLRSNAVQQRFKGKPRLIKNVLKYAHYAARDIEKLAPAIDREATPCNVEYPWEDGTLMVPCQYQFPNLTRIDSKTIEGAKFLKVISTAFGIFSEELERERARASG